MATVKHTGVLNGVTGTIDGVIVYSRGDKLYVRSVPTFPSSMFKTPQARKKQAVFKLVQMHRKYHLGTIRKTIEAPKTSSSYNLYYKLNAKALNAAVNELADKYCAGELVTITDVEHAICAYAAEHPESIIIGSKSGFHNIYLSGEWPDIFTFKPQNGKNSIIITVSEK